MIARSYQDDGTANSGITCNIYWLCYYTVHVFVIIHFCDSMWLFWVEANMYCFLSFVYICFAIGDSVIHRGMLESH